MSFVGGDASGVSPSLDFQAVQGSKSPSNGSKTFVNNYFHPNLSITSATLSNGARILKINGYLERYIERPKLVIPPEMIAEDVEYFYNLLSY